MKVYIITYSWANKASGHDEGVYDVYLDLQQATKNFIEMVKEDARCFKEEVCPDEEITEVCQTEDDGSRYVHYGNDNDEWYSAKLSVCEPK